MRRQDISLVRRADLSADISQLYLNKIGGTPYGFEIPFDGYVPKASPLNCDPVAETITLNLIGTEDEIVALDDLLDQKERECAWSPDLSERYQMWLRIGAYQAVIGGLRKENGTAPAFPTSKGMEEQRVLGFMRGPFENFSIAAPTSYALSNVLCMAGKQTGALVGVMPGRLAGVAFQPHAGSGIMDEYWWGFKGKNGVPSTFTSPWELRAIAAGQRSADTAVVTASRYWFVTDFGTTQPMTPRFWGFADDISAGYYTSLRGTYKILASMYVDAGFTVRVQMFSGMEDGAKTYNDPILITGATAMLYDLGNFTFPAGGVSAVDALAASCVGLSAEYVAGTIADGVGLHVDTCLVPIPVDEGCGHVKSATSVEGVLSVFVDALGRVTSYDIESGYRVKNIPDTTGVCQRNSVVPVGDNVVVVAGQRLSSFVATDTIDATFSVFPRWRAPR